MPQTTIVEAKNIIRSIRQKYDYDFSSYSLNHFRYQLDKIMSHHHFKYHDILINRLLKDEEFFDAFLHDITVNETELFRDPEMWQMLSDNVLGMLNGISDKIKIWIPELSNGLELFSLLIILNEINIQKNVEVYASSLSNKRLSEVKKGITDKKILELSSDNFKKSGFKNKTGKYFQKKDNEFYFLKTLLKDVNFFQTDLKFTSAPKHMNLIIYRNKFLCLSFDYQNVSIKKLVSSLDQGGVLIIGNKEYPEDFLRSYSLLSDFNRSESIFKKTGKESE